MDKSFLNGIKFGFGFLLVISLFLGIVFAVGFHTTSEIIPGTFQGDYEFNGSVNFSGQVFGVSNILTNNTIIELATGTCPSEYVDISTNSTMDLTITGSQFTNAVARSDRVFDGVTPQGSTTGTYWGLPVEGYVGKYWGTNKIISSVTATSLSDDGFVTGSNIVNLTLQGSDNNSTWVDLGDIDSTDSAGLVLSITNIDISTSYTYHRIRIINENGGNVAGFAEIEFDELQVRCKVSN